MSGAPIAHCPLLCLSVTLSARVKQCLTVLHFCDVQGSKFPADNALCFAMTLESIIWGMIQHIHTFLHINLHTALEVGT